MRRPNRLFLSETKVSGRLKPYYVEESGLRRQAGRQAPSSDRICIFSLIASVNSKCSLISSPALSKWYKWNSVLSPTMSLQYQQEDRGRRDVHIPPPTEEEITPTPPLLEPSGNARQPFIPKKSVQRKSISPLSTTVVGGRWKKPSYTTTCQRLGS